jgi:hypothetical protein
MLPAAKGRGAICLVRLETVLVSILQHDVCVSVCVCVCVREREREFTTCVREREREREFTSQSRVRDDKLDHRTVSNNVELHSRFVLCLEI